MCTVERPPFPWLSLTAAVHCSVDGKDGSVTFHHAGVGHDMWWDCLFLVLVSRL